MADEMYAVSGETLTGIANAIRSKTGSDDFMTVSVFASAIEGISGDSVEVAACPSNKILYTASEINLFLASWIEGYDSVLWIIAVDDTHAPDKLLFMRKTERYASGLVGATSESTYYRIRDYSTGQTTKFYENNLYYVFRKDG